MAAGLIEWVDVVNVEDAVIVVVIFTVIAEPVEVIIRSNPTLTRGVEALSLYGELHPAATAELGVDDDPIFAWGGARDHDASAR